MQSYQLHYLRVDLFKGHNAQLIPAVFIPALPGNSWAYAHVFILQMGHLKFYYRPEVAICLPLGLPQNILHRFGFGLAWTCSPGEYDHPQLYHLIYSFPFGHILYGST